MKKITLSLIYALITCYTFASNEKYRIVITDDPATTIMIGWNQTSGSSPVVYYGTTDHGTTWNNYPNSKNVDRTVSYKGMTNTFAKLSGLTPDTNYYFVIRDSQGVSQRFWFRTAPNTNETMSFISGGDSRNNRTPRQNANKLVAKLKPTAVFFGGDMTNGDSSGEWQDWFDDWQLTIAADGRMFPIIPARGNHEGSNNSIYDLFNVPSTNIYYDITFGANLYTIYTLNSEITAGGSQYSWLQGKLNTDTSIWKSAQYHKPMRPHVGSKSEGNDEYNNWAQLFYDEGVRLVYESDSHTVKTTWPIKPCSSGANCDEGFERDDNFGSIYVGEGCWGAPLRTADDAKVWTRNSASFNQFKWVCVSEAQITVKTIQVDNADSVGENSNTNVCDLPSGINVWNPSNGDTVTIVNTILQAPDINITTPIDGAYIADGNGVSIETNASDADGTIDFVEFKIDNVVVGTDNTVPYQLSNNFADGAHTVEVVVYDNHGLTDSHMINIAVGDFNDQIAVVANDDVEQGEGDGNIYSSSSDLELVYDSYDSQGYQTIGIRFANLNIPKNAIINSAYVQFTADGSYSNTAEFLVFAEDTDNAAAFETDAFNVTSRSYTSGIYWSPAAWSSGDAGIAQRTPSLAAKIQDIVNKSGWSTGNAVCIKIEGTGVSLTSTSAKRKAESIDGLAAPVLHIDYSVNSSVLSVNDQQVEVKEVIVYPNPVKDTLHFILPDSSKEWYAELFTIGGRKVWSRSIVNNVIEVKNFYTGVYIIRVFNGTSGKEVYTSKILIE